MEFSLIEVSLMEVYVNEVSLYYQTRTYFTDTSDRITLRVSYLEIWLGRYVRAKNAASGSLPVAISTSRLFSKLPNQKTPKSHPNRPRRHPLAKPKPAY